MYSIRDFGEMIANTPRMKAYAHALERAVTDDSIVVDIGTGHGIMALLACRYGASQVYAIETEEAILLGQQFARDNGYFDKIRFIQDLSTNIRLPQQAQVIVSDLRGALPLFGQHIPSIIDARTRFLAPGGVLIPRQDKLWGAVVEVPELYKSYTSPWNDNPFGFNLHKGQYYVTNNWTKAKINPDQLLTEPECWYTINYDTVSEPDVKAAVTWEVNKPGTSHGICLWFDTVLSEGIGFSNAPGEPELVYGKGFFPWPEPVDLLPGDIITVNLQAVLASDDYIWNWQSKIVGQGNSGKLKSSFKQSTFFATPLTPEKLKRQSGKFKPQINDSGKVVKFILDLINEEQPLEDIARELSREFPDRFPTLPKALARVIELSEKYSR